MPWEAADAELILPVLLGDNVEPKKTRRHSQDYTNVINYFDEQVWDLLLDPDKPSLAKQACIFTVAQGLGLYIVSEFTYKRMVAILMMVTESWDTLVSMSVHDKKIEIWIS